MVTSTYEAEAIALTQAAEEALAIKRQVIGLTGIPDDLIEIELYCDNHDVIQSGLFCEMVWEAKSLIAIGL